MIFLFIFIIIRFNILLYYIRFRFYNLFYIDYILDWLFIRGGIIMINNFFLNDILGWINFGRVFNESIFIVYELFICINYSI